MTYAAAGGSSASLRSVGLSLANDFFALPNTANRYVDIVVELLVQNHELIRCHYLYVQQLANCKSGEKAEHDRASTALVRSICHRVRRDLILPLMNNSHTNENHYFRTFCEIITIWRTSHEEREKH